MKLEEIERIVKAATEGPWEWESTDETAILVGPEPHQYKDHTLSGKEGDVVLMAHSEGYDGETSLRVSPENRTAIATMRNVIEDLLAVARAAKHFREMQETYEQDPTCEECRDYRDDAYSEMGEALEKFK